MAYSLFVNLLVLGLAFVSLLRSFGNLPRADNLGLVTELYIRKVFVNHSYALLIHGVLWALFCPSFFLVLSTPAGFQVDRRSIRGSWHFPFLCGKLLPLWTVKYSCLAQDRPRCIFITKL